MSLFFLLPRGPSPIVYDLSSLPSAYTDQDTTETQYRVQVIFNYTQDGDIDINRNVEADLTGVEIYIDPSNGQALWVRCTQNSGTALNEGNTVGDWISLVSGSIFYGLVYTAGAGPDQITANVTFALATDSGGSNVVATSAAMDITVGSTA